jgi:TRAP-type C4-dicarboxylate transport system permease small subunit
MSTPPPPPAQPEWGQPQPVPRKSQATTALVLGILGLVCCGVLAPIAWYIGKQELQAIERGEAPAGGQGSAKAGQILGIIGTVFLILGILWLLFFGGLALLGAFGEFAEW